MNPADLRRNGYALYQEGTFVSWCGHGQPFVPLLVGEDLVEFVPIVGEAS